MAMMRVIAILVGLLGLLFLVPGVLSIISSIGGMFPPMAEGAILGAVLVVVAVLLWRRSAGRGTAQLHDAADDAPRRS
ncbi:MAG: hypothetical protein ACJAQZ_002633 [Planctomycetota bacterium]|jgi:membrane protein implicated in regulation of membrane protease activity